VRESLQNQNIVITETTFFSLKPNQKGLVGISSVVFNNSLCLNSISVYVRPNGELRLLFPIKVLPNAKEVNVYYPINSETYDAIKKAVEDKYKQITTNLSDR
jgi:DNA-binding cell septation regulator SpoVG